MTLQITDNHSFSSGKIRVLGAGVHLMTKFSKDHWKSGPWSTAAGEIRNAQCVAQRVQLQSADHVVVNEQDVHNAKRKIKVLPPAPKFAKLSMCSTGITEACPSLRVLMLGWAVHSFGVRRVLAAARSLEYILVVRGRILLSWPHANLNPGTTVSGSWSS